MQAAIEEAQKARAAGDYAVGAVIVKDGKIIVRAVNRAKQDNDPTQHAEVVAIRDASKIFNSRHLDGCILYTTHEPCPMCASATVWAKMAGVVFGVRIEDMHEFKLKNGNEEWQWRTIKVPASVILKNGDPQIPLVENFMREECKKLFHS